MKQKIIKLISITSFIVILDQITKFIAVTKIPLNHSITIIPNFFNLLHLRNPGGAFSFLAKSSENIRFFVFIFLSILAIFFILYLYFKIDKKNKWLSTSMAMIFGGACGNMIDRLRFRYVVDFFDFQIKNYHWPAFNIADSAISIAMVIFAFHIIFKKMPNNF